jgi:hypothetical protein
MVVREREDHILSHPCHSRLFVWPVVLEPDLESPKAFSKAGHPPAAATIAMLRKMASIPSELIGAAGRRYLFKELIQERLYLGRVWLATSEHPCHSYHPTRELTTFQIRTR